MDAKVATADMASRLMVWAEIGKPNQREWTPSRGGYAKNDGLYPSGYVLLGAAEHAPAAAPAKEKPEKKEPAKTASLKDRLWKGWVLPASDADTWFVAGSAAYYRVLESDDLEKAMEVERAGYRGLKLGAAECAVALPLEGPRARCSWTHCGARWATTRSSS